MTGSSHSRRSQKGSRGKKRRTTLSTLAFQSLEPRFAFAGLQAAAVPFAPQDITVVGDVSYFVATTAAEGTELWKTDGTPAGTAIVKDINAGVGDSYPRDITAVGSTLFFTADDGVHGRELWKTDGTAAGTVLVKDIKAGTEMSYDWETDTDVEVPAASYPFNLIAFDSQLFFVADDGVHGSELWKSDGTAAGTVLVKDIITDESVSNPQGYVLDIGSHPRELVVFAGKLFFSATDGYDEDTQDAVRKYWSSDGTADGTNVLTDRVIPVVYRRYFYSYDINSFVVSGNRMFFAGDDGVNGTELWVTDGTADGTALLKDIAAGGRGSVDQLVPNSSSPGTFTLVGSTVFFTADDGVHGRELWKTDGTAAGTVLVKNIAAGTWQQSSWDENDEPIQITVPLDSFPESLTALGNTLVFVADDGVNGRELWTSDGTANGTVLVKDLQAGNNADVPRSSSPNDLTPYEGAVFFAANGDELWKTDGTEAGTTKVKDIDPRRGGDEGSGSYASMAVFSGKLLFGADDGVNGSDLWVSDGSTAGTVRLKDLPETLLSATTVMENQPVGTAVGTLSTTDPDAGKTFTYTLVSGAGSTDNALFTIEGDILKTAASFDFDAKSSHSIRVRSADQDGLSTETRFTITVTNLAETRLSPAGMTVVGDVTYFTATTAAEGTELWKTDGTAAGTAIVKDINAGAGDSYPGQITAVGSTVFFTADDGVNGRELWKTDGTAAGTVLVKDIKTGTELVYLWDMNLLFPITVEGPASSSPSNLIAFDNQLVFTADDGVNGSGLWISDGTAAGTVLVKTNAMNLELFAGQIFFSDGESLWSSDGTAGGTTIVKSGVYQNLNGSSRYSASPVVGGKLIFSGFDDVNGTELWVTDGTAAGTALLKDIATGSSSSGEFTSPKSSDPGQFAVVGSTVFFVADDRQNGRELWRTDGTADGTVLVKNIAEGTRQQSWYDENYEPIQITVPRESYLGSLTAFGNTLVFVADDGVNGREIWKSDGTENGTVLVKDLLTGTNNANVPRTSAPNDLTPYNDAVFFIANGDELWKTDGTEAGATRVKDIDPNKGGDEGSGSYASMVVFNGKLLFAADDGVNGSELWVSDGSTAGTVRLNDLPLAPASVVLSATTIAENQPAGTAVGTLSTTDSDAGNTFTYTLVPGDGSTDNGSFTIDGGVLKTAASFDFDTKSSYSIRVRSADQGGLSTEKTFTVAVTNVNETPTDILLSATTVAENQASGTAVGTLSTTDPDAGNTFTYTLVPGTGSTDNGSFTIDGGVLKTAVSFDFDTKSSYSIRVRSADQDGLATEKTFTVTVTNVNETPTNILLSAATVAENQASGTAVGTLSTTDPDAGNTFTYTLVPGDGSTDNGSFTIDGGVLKTAASFDFETKSSYSIRVRSADQGGLSTEKTFTVTVTNVNETPTDILLSATNVAENQPAGTAVGTLTSTDPDAGNTFTYTLVSGTGSTDNASFTIEGNVLKTAASFDFETKSSYSIRVRSDDQDGLSTEKTFTVTVTDVVEVPGVPTDVVGTAGNGQVILSWTSPTFNGGAAITDYVVEYSSNGGSTWAQFNDGVSAATTALVTSLANGTSYLFRVAAVNAVGTGGFSVNSAAVAPKAVPGAPTGVTGIAGVGQVTLSWTAPVVRGSSAIADYRVQYSSNGGSTWTQFNDAVSAAAKAKVTGLANGTSYVFRVAAVNGAGTGLSSVASAAVTPRTVPGGPTSVNAVAGSKIATVTWTAPTANGGAVVTDYRVQYSSNNGATWRTFSDATSAATAATVTGLANGTSYVFRIAAVNTAGAGAYTAKSAAVTPRTVPGVPTGLAGVAGQGSVTLRWTAPASNGGAAVVDHRVQYSSDNGVTWTAFTGATTAARTATVTGLTNGTRYVFRVAAVNTAGAGAYTAKSAAATPRTWPGAPTNLTATPAARRVNLAWQAPASNGGAAIKDYIVQYSSNNGATWRVFKESVSSATSASVTGLTRGTSYVFRVVGMNAAGSGEYSEKSSAVVAR